MGQEQITSIEQQLHDIQQSVNQLLTAFPGGDVVGHRLYHESRIRAAMAEEKFWTDLKTDAAKKGIFFIFTVLVGLILLGLSVKLGIGGLSK